MDGFISNLRDQLWPEIRDRESARKAAIQGFAGATFQALSDVAIAAWAASKASLFGVKPAIFIIAAAIFAAIAIGIFRLARAAAVAGLVLFLPTQIWFLLSDRSAADFFRTFMLTIAFGLLFANGVRGTFAYRRFMAGDPGAVPPRLNKPEKQAL